jgi:conjugal transfer ATP-binding protein TraC
MPGLMDGLKGLFKAAEPNFVEEGEDFASVRDSSIKVPTIDRFSNYLPYTAYDPDTQLFIIESDKPGKIEGIGFCIEVSPQTGASPEMAEFLTNLFTSGAPAGTGMQFSIFATPIIDNFLNRYMATTREVTPGMSPEATKQTLLVRKLAQKRVEYYKKGAKTPMFNDMNYLLRNYRGMMSVVVPCDNPDDERLKREVLTLRETCIATLKAYYLYQFNWTAEDLINWCALVLNPHMMMASDIPKLEYDSYKEIRKQIISQDTHIKEEEDHLLFSGGGYQPVAVRGMSVRAYPRKMVLAQVGHLIGHIRSYTIAYNCPFLITMGVQILDFDSAKNQTLLKGARATQTVHSPMAKFMPDSEEKKDDLDCAILSFDEGKGTVRMYHQVLLFSTPSDVYDAEQAAKSVWRAESYDIATDRKCQKQAVMDALPMLFGPLMQRDLKLFQRSSTKTIYNAANSIPCVAEWGGIGEPVLSMFGRRGQSMSIDVFANPAGNYNGCVVGASGSGKSNFLIELALRTMATGGKVWIIDVGRSYEKLCHIIGGQYVEFKADTDICMNPFDMVRDIDDDMDILKALLAQMVQPTSALDDYEISQLEIHIRQLWAEFGPRMTMDQLAENLMKSCYEGGAIDEFDANDNRRYEEICDPVIRRLGVQLFPYTSAGSYGKFFNGPANINFNSNFVVLELEELKSRKDLQSVAMLLLMYRITNEMYSGQRGQRQLVIIDEAWDLMDSGNAGKFIEAGYRRARKYGGAFFTGTQSIGDYFKSETAKAAFDNADWMFLLRQKAESVEELQKSGKMIMDEYTKSMLLSVTTASGRFAEVFMRCADMPPTIGRLFFDPFTMLMASTKAEDFALVNRLKDQGYTTEEALEIILQDRGFQQ